VPRGGKRAGAPGRSYSNRTDLNATRSLPAQVGPSQQYGQGAAQMRAQQAVPMAAPPRPAPTAGVPQVAPTAPTPLDAATARPNEPVTAGAALGAGPGLEAIAAHGLGGDDLDELRVLYQRFPQYDELREIIEEIEEGGI
jgi:hypothetical protein